MTNARGEVMSSAILCTQRKVFLNLCDYMSVARTPGKCRDSHARVRTDLTIRATAQGSVAGQWRLRAKLELFRALAEHSFNCGRIAVQKLPRNLSDRRSPQTPTMDVRRRYDTMIEHGTPPCRKYELTV